MEIDEKYFKLLNLLIHDKRTGMNGMIASIDIMQVIGGRVISYRAFMNTVYSNVPIFVQDFESGNVVFLLPFDVGYMEEIMNKLSEDYEQRIKEFFGDKFREDMIVKISEGVRKEEIRKWEELTRGIENWNKIYSRNYSWINANRELPEQGKRVLCAVKYKTEEEQDQLYLDMAMVNKNGNWYGLRYDDEKDNIVYWRYLPDMPKQWRS